MTDSIHIELQSIENNNENDDNEQAAAGNGGCTTQTDAAPSENDRLIEISPTEDVAAGNNSSVPDREHGVTESRKAKALKRVKKELNKTVVWKLKLWMVIIIVLFAIIFVTFFSIFLRIALYKDPDEKFDVSSFVVPRVFSGSLSVVNQNFSKHTTAPLHDLATQVQDKLSELYRSSHALGRYFSYAKVETLREGSVIIEFCLKFLMPLDSDLLQRYTLSQEMVSGVLRQHLFDLEASDGAKDPLYIHPNATIRDGGSSCTK